MNLDAEFTRLHVTQDVAGRAYDPNNASADSFTGFCFDAAGTPQVSASPSNVGYAPIAGELRPYADCDEAVNQQLAAGGGLGADMMQREDGNAAIFEPQIQGQITSLVTDSRPDSNTMADDEDDWEIIDGPED